MLNRNKLLSYLEEYLQISNFQDYCVNGLQVEGKETVSRIITSVSVSQKLFDSAIEMNADLIIVHHGLFWRGSGSPFKLTGIMKNRVKQLLDHNINLAAYHLPLDAHPQIGNNARMLEKLGYPCSEPFEVGFLSRLDHPVKPTELETKLNLNLPDPVTLYGDQTGDIRTIAVVSGGAAGSLDDAWEKGADALVTGEVSEPAVRLAEEMGVCFVCAGHYNTERFGPQAMADHLEQTFQLPCSFIDVPNPV